MKKVLMFLALVIGLPLLVGAGLFGYAMTVDEFTYQNHVRIEAPVEEVWALLQDEKRLPEWLHGLQSVELLSGERLQPGSVWRLAFDIEGHALEITETVTAVTPPERYAFDVDNDYYEGHTELTLRAVEGGTALRSQASIAAKSAVFRGVFYLQRDLIAEESQSSYAALASLAEAKPK